METLRKSLIVFIIFVFGISVPSLLLSQENLSEIVKRVKPSTVVILVLDGRGKPLGLGSGFFISRKGDVISNRHVFQGAAKAEIKTTEGNVYPVKQVVAEDNEGDIIRVSVDIPLDVAIPLTISSALPEEGERILVIGNPEGFEQTISDGIISAVRDVQGFGKIMQITAPISHGSSGSPVVNNRGEVVGIITAFIQEGQNLNFAIPSQRILHLASLSDKSVATWNQGYARRYYEDGKRQLKFKDFVMLTNNVPMTIDSPKALGKALESFLKAIAIDPQYLDAYVAAGRCYSALHKHQEAAEKIKQAISIMPFDADLFISLSYEYRFLGRSEEAIQTLKRAIEIRNSDPDAYWELGNIYLLSTTNNPQASLENYNKAIESYLRAIQVKPDFTSAYNMLAVAYEGLGKYPLAVDTLKQGISIAPDDHLLHEGLGMAYIRMGDLESANKEYMILCELAKKNLPSISASVARLKEAIDKKRESRTDLPPLTIPPLK